MIAPIIPPTIVPPAEHLSTLVGESSGTVWKAIDFDVMLAWVVEDIVGETVIVVDMSAEGQEFVLSFAMIIIMVNNSHFIL